MEVSGVPLRRTGQLLAKGRRRVVLPDTEKLADLMLELAVGPGGVEGYAPALDPGRVAPVPAKLVDQAALAEARLADNEDDLPSPLTQLG